MSRDCLIESRELLAVSAMYFVGHAYGTSVAQ